MTTISAKVIADSIGEEAPRLTTLQLRFPRFILSEFNTHRVFSRNARSSRAVPIDTMIKEIESDPVIPLHWGAAQKGMQAERENEAPVFFLRHFTASGPDYKTRDAAWLAARDSAVHYAKAFAEAGYHKQVVNRLLEPFMHIDVLVTTTEWVNFFALRDHPAAEPHIRMLAAAMKEAMAGSEPIKLELNHWHLPYVGNVDVRGLMDRFAARGPKELQRAGNMVSAARCARISYKQFDGEQASIEADLALAEKLATSGHWSPFEHQATPDISVGLAIGGWRNPDDHGNLVGWRQFRKTFVGESGLGDGREAAA